LTASNDAGAEPATLSARQLQNVAATKKRHKARRHIERGGRALYPNRITPVDLRRSSVAPAG
jgi:hypothetical protein